MMKEYLRVFGLGFLVIIAGFILASQFIKPSPPQSIRIATGSVSGAYFAYAQRYRELLQEQGIELTIVNTAGSIENIQRLLSDDVDIAFVQSGTGQPYKNSVSDAGHRLESLASVYHEPLWLFMSEADTHRGDVINSVVNPVVNSVAGADVHLDTSLEESKAPNASDLQGKRIAVGELGSGTRALANIVLNNNGITEENAVFLSLSNDAAADALLNGEIDYMFVVSSVDAPVIQRLFLETAISPFDFERAKAYTRRYRFLSATELPQGVINFQDNIPNADVNLLSAAATLVVNSDIHPALATLLMQTFDEIHKEGGILEEPGEFPSEHYVDFPIAKDAQRYFEYGPPLLQRYLPFSAAVLVNQLKVFLIPLVALLIPLMRVLPILYRWRIRSRIYRWYKQLREIEQQISMSDDINTIAPEVKQQLLSKLHKMHQSLMAESIPLSYHDELYHLRVHIELVRDTLLQASLLHASLSHSA